MYCLLFCSKVANTKTNIFLVPRIQCKGKTNSNHCRIRSLTAQIIFEDFEARLES